MQAAAPKPKAIRRAHPGQGVPMWHASKWPNQRSCVENGERGLGRDHLYSVAALTDSAGAVVERYRYDTHGNRTVLAADGVTTRAASLYGQQIGFTGRYEDKETKLWYFRARYYSGSLGRFIGRDPLGYVDGMGMYGAYFIPNALDPFGFTETTTITSNPGASVPTGVDSTGGPIVPQPPIGPPATTTPNPGPGGPTFLGVQLGSDPVSMALWSHYNLSLGTTFNVSGYQQVLDIAREQVMKAIEDQKIEALTKWLDAGTCPALDSGSRRGPHRKVVFGGGVKAIDYKGAINGLGSANMRIKYKCQAVYTCVCCASGAWKPIVGSYKCEFGYFFYDQYRDAADWFNNTPADDEYAGTLGFNIIGSWTVVREEKMRKLGSCP